MENYYNCSSCLHPECTTPQTRNQRYSIFLLLLLIPLLFFVVLRKGKSTEEAEKEVA